MRQLQLHEIAAYLPYGLKIQCTDGIIEQLSTLTQSSLNIEGRPTIFGMFADIEDIKPILRPMSDLTDEMAVKSGYKNANALRLMIISKMIPYKGMENLFANHYDVFNLIPDGLAIDVNLIEQKGGNDGL